MNKINPPVNFHIVMLLLLLILAKGHVFCQAPAGLSFQAVLRNVSGDPISDTRADIELFILQGDITGPVIYSESHSITTNAFGLINLALGVKDTAGFSAIDWSVGPCFIKIAVDGMEMGISPLLSVPYALFASNGNGTTGPAGETGSPGPMGDKGDTGLQGPKGSIGEPGDAGPRGPKGDKGDTGQKGPAGDTGIKGAEGDMGQQGSQGDVGDTGTKGLKGNTGETGIRGPKGDQGESGIKGPKGDQGNAGPKGLKGDAGDAGSRGPDGYTGPVGPARCIAFGCIGSDGSILSGTGNFTCNLDIQKRLYRITISGEDYFYASYSTLVTPTTVNTPYASITDSADGDLLVELTTLYGTGWQTIFHFAVFKN